MMKAISMVLLGGVALAALTSAPAFAQDAAQSDGQASNVPDDIVVKGIRRSIADAIETKRDAPVIMDVISAEDIGKLPDQNVAETLSRVPGVQITRMEGQGNAVSVRGILLNKVQLNGQSFIGSAGDGAPKLSDIAPELLASAEVIKSPSADQPEGWLGALINLRTKRPLDFRDPVYSGRIVGVYADRVEKGGFKVSGLTAQQFANDTIGVLLAGSYSSEAGRSDQYNSGGWVDVISAYGVDATGDGVADHFAMPLRLQRMVDVYRSRNLALNGSLQWKPSSDWNIVLDGFYSRLDSDRVLTASQAILNPLAVTKGVILPDGTLSKASFGGVTYRPLAYDDDGWASSNAISLTADYDHGPWQLRFSASQSRGTGRARDGLTTDVGSVGNARVLVARQIAGDTMSIDYDVAGNPVSPNFKLNANFNTLDPTQYEIYSTFDAEYPIRNRGREARADIRYELGSGVLKAIKVGGRFEDVKIYSAQEVVTYPALSTYDPTPGNSLRVTEVPGLNYGGTISGFMGGAGGDFPRDMLTGSPDASLWRTFLHASGPSLTPLDAKITVAQVHQTTSAAYAKVEAGGNLFGLPFDGDAGLRYVNARRTAFGYTIAGTAAVPTTVERRFDTFLPSANFILHPSKNFDIRFGAAKVTARPPLNLTSVAIGLSLVSGTGSAGNPDLKPFEATQYDVSAEWYFAPASMVSLALFKKHVSAFTRIIQVSENHPEAPNNTNGSTTYLVNRPVNGDSGSIKGFEVNYQHALSFLPAPLDGLGYQLSYTYSDSRTPNIDEFTKSVLPLPASSKHSANAIIYYEKGGFSTRVAYNYRSSFLVAQQGTASGGSVFANGRGQWDVSASYDLTKQFKLTFAGVNVGHNVNSFYVGNKNRVYNAYVDDSRFYFGIAATF